MWQPSTVYDIILFMYMISICPVSQLHLQINACEEWEEKGDESFEVVALKKRDRTN